MRLAWDAQPVFKPPQWLGTLTSLGDILIHVKGTHLGNWPAPALITVTDNPISTV